MKSINLRTFRPSIGTSYSGRPQGLEVRKDIDLDKIDNSDEEVEILIPSDTSSFNPSFFLGLFFKSISKLGVQNFKNKYKIKFETESKVLIDILNKDIEDGFRNAINTLENKNAISVFK